MVGVCVTSQPMGGHYSHYDQCLRFITFAPLQSQYKHRRDWCVTDENPLFIVLMLTLEDLKTRERGINAAQ